VLRVTPALSLDAARWRGADLAGQTSWIHELSDGEVAELSAVVDDTRRRGVGVDAMRRDDVSLPTLAPVVES
jgi:hypothetical protein